MTPEGKVKLKVRRILNRWANQELMDIFMPVPSGFGESRLDFICCIGGNYLAIETKRGGGKPTARQDKMIRSIRKAGGTVFVVTSEETAHALEQYLELTYGIPTQPQAEASRDPVPPSNP